jgi:hypothetical protein
MTASVYHVTIPGPRSNINMHSDADEFDSMNCASNVVIIRQISSVAGPAPPAWSAPAASILSSL